MSGADRKPKIPEAPTPAAIPGNLLSNIAPPIQLPNFVTAEVPSQSAATPIPASQLPPASGNLPPPPASQLPPQSKQPVSVTTKVDSQPETQETFSPAIPLSAQQPGPTMMSPEEPQPKITSENSSEVDKIGDIMPGSGLFTWVKGAVTNGGILQKVAEKAMNSVDTMITTLDPQMKEYLKSGGDTFVVVASDKDVKIAPVREAFQSVFGKATVIGYAAQSDVTATQPVGYAAAYAAAKQRIAHVRSTNAQLNNNVPVVAIENFLQETVADRWFDMGLIVLSQPSLGIELQLQSQSVPVPSAAVQAMRAATPPDYPHSQTGYSVTIGSIMGDSLQVPHSNWHEASTGVSRKEILTLAAKSLAGSYKKLLAISAAET